MFPTALTVGPLQAWLPTETIQIQDAPNGAWRSVDKVFVDRKVPGDMVGTKQGDRPRFELEIHNDPVAGVAAGFDKAQVTFCVAQRIGGAADPTVPANLMHCFKILGQDEGMIRLELR
jgi:hypothetical protein